MTTPRPSTITIGALAKEAEVPTSTVRYYEKRGLLIPLGRTAANYRVYGDEAVERLQFVKSAQAAGLTLTDIAALLELREDAAPCAEVQELIAARLDRVVDQLGHLQDVEGMLRKWLKVCQGGGRSGPCGVLEGLAISNE